jgi:hypothetical protein
MTFPLLRIPGASQLPIAAIALFAFGHMALTPDLLQVGFD